MNPSHAAFGKQIDQGIHLCTLISAVRSPSLSRSSDFLIWRRSQWSSGLLLCYVSKSGRGKNECMSFSDTFENVSRYTKQTLNKDPVNRAILCSRTFRCTVRYFKWMKDSFGIGLKVIVIENTCRKSFWSGQQKCESSRILWITYIETL